MATLNLATTWCEGSSGWGGTDSFKPLGWQHPCSTEFWSKRTSNLAEAPTSRAPEPYPHEPLASHRFPPLHTRCTGDLSGRPFCRIYFSFSRQVWVLELKPAIGGWMERERSNEHRSQLSQAVCLVFPTLSGAIGYAVQHGFDYYVIPPPRGSKPTTRRERGNRASSRTARAATRLRAN